MSLESSRKPPDTTPKESYLDRVVRLALTAGQRKIELDKANAAIARVEALHHPTKLGPREPDSLDVCAGCATSQTFTYYSKCKTRAALAGDS